MKRDNSHNEFVGNFDSFFDNESSLTGAIDFGGDLGSPISLPSSPMPPRTPRNLTLGPKIQLSPAISFISENTPKYRCKITPPYYIRDDVNGTVLDYTKCPKRIVSIGVSTGPQTPPSSGSGGGGTTTTTTTTTGGGGIISDTVSTSSNQSETATEQKPNEVKKTEIEKESNCNINHVLIFGFLVIGVIIAYFIAKKFKKDEFIFGITGGFVGAIIGYLYSKNKCK